MKIANIDKEILRNFWTTWGISMKFSGKMCLMVILKVTKNQVVIKILSLNSLIGDHVRISKKDIFAEGYTPNWFEKISII